MQQKLQNQESLKTHPVEEEPTLRKSSSANMMATIQQFAEEGDVDVELLDTPNNGQPNQHFQSANNTPTPDHEAKNVPFGYLETNLDKSSSFHVRKLQKFPTSSESNIASSLGPYKQSSSPLSPDKLLGLNTSPPPKRTIILGVCCMEKKLKSRPMTKILNWLEKSEEIKICPMNDDMILNKPIEDWIRCDVLIGFYSFGFPLDKAIAYVKQYKPKMINDLTAQHCLWDRSQVLAKLAKIGVPIAQSYPVWRGEEAAKIAASDEFDGMIFTQAEIEKQAGETKDKGEFYLEKAVKMEKDAKEDEERLEELLQRKSLEYKKAVSQGELPSIKYFVGATHYTKDEVAARQTEQESNQEGISSDPYEVTTNQSETSKADLEIIGISDCEDEEDDNGDHPELLYEDDQIKEYDDYIMIRGNRLDKPFLEKPLNAEDHEIYIHYSQDSPCGSGYSVLFRKTQDNCSQFFPTEGKSAIRTEGSYLYEQFLPTDGFDIKVYTVGADYAHAEARKAPSLDGKVQRDPKSGKEMRYPVNLSAWEKQIAARICLEFKQDICGFDMLRSHGTTYVCDVNGFSFVKTSDKYYQDCATQIRNIIYSKLSLTPDVNRVSTTLSDTNSQLSSSVVRPYRPNEEKSKKTGWELRSVVAVFRHGDRTPKQKMKMTTTDKDFLKFFQGKNKQVKLKKPRELQKVLQITKDKIEKILTKETTDDIEKEKDALEKMFQLKYILEKDRFEGLNRKIQLKPLKTEEIMRNGVKKTKITEALFILKFGGELTHAGMAQALQFGDTFRKKMYVEDSKSGEGLLRLHSTYRHDLKCYTSDEGRCQKTAAAFLRGLLTLEGALAPILAIMISNDKQAQQMLDDSSEAGELLLMIKKKLNEFMHYDGDNLVKKYIELFGEEPIRIVGSVLKQIKNPFKKMQKIRKLMGLLIEDLEKRLLKEGEDIGNMESYRQTDKEFEKIFHKRDHTSSAFTESSVGDGDSALEYVMGLDTKAFKEVYNEKKPKARLSTRVTDFGVLDAEHQKQEGEGDDLQRQQSDYLLTKQDLKTLLEDNEEDEEDKVAEKKETEEAPIEAGISVDDNIKSRTKACDGEPLLMCLKRWKKIHNDFSKKGVKFDISKIPEVCDNIKFDNLHCPELIDKVRLELMDQAQLMCRLLVPLEYGLSTDNKIQVGVKIIGPLLKKVRNDLLWWKTPDNQGNAYEHEKRKWDQTGLDQNRVGDLVKSHWRHIRTRLYFTSASHLYTLLNTLKLGVNSILIEKSDQEKLDSILRLDFMSSFVFRLFENLHVEEDDPSRFKLEMMVNRGAVTDSEEITKVEQHTIPIKHNLFVDINKKLNLDEIDTFFANLLRTEEDRVSSPSADLKRASQAQTSGEQQNEILKLHVTETTEESKETSAQ